MPSPLPPEVEQAAREIRGSYFARGPGRYEAWWDEDITRILRALWLTAQVAQASHHIWTCRECGDCHSANQRLSSLRAQLQGDQNERETDTNGLRSFSSLSGSGAEAYVRLRSDEWLLAAAEEYFGGSDYYTPREFLAIARRWRDGEIGKG